MRICSNAMSKWGLFVFFMAAVFAGNAIGVEVEYKTGCYVSKKNVPPSWLSEGGRLKFPFVADDYLMFIDLASDGGRLFAYDLDHVMGPDKSGFCALEPAMVHPEIKINQEKVSFLDQVPSPGRLVSFSRGPIFWEDVDNNFIFKSIPDNRPISLPIMNSDERPVTLMKSKNKVTFISHDYLYDQKGKKQTIDNSEGLFDFDMHPDGKKYAVSYHDLNNFPRVCIHEKGSQRVLKSENPIFYPRFSQSGEYLAVAYVDKNNIWGLYIYDIVNLKEPVQTVARVNVYDCRADNYFLYPNSFAWLGDELYFTKMGDSLKVFRIKCGPKCSEDELGFPNSFSVCNAYKKIRNRLDDIEGRNDQEILEKRAEWISDHFLYQQVWAKSDGETLITLNHVSWVYPFSYKGENFLAVQASVKQKLQGRPSSSSTNILIFKILEETL